LPCLAGFRVTGGAAFKPLLREARGLAAAALVFFAFITRVDFALVLVNRSGPGKSIQTVAPSQFVTDLSFYFNRMTAPCGRSAWSASVVAVTAPAATGALAG